MDWEAIPAVNMAYGDVAGTVFGWTVYRAPLVRSGLDDTLIVHRKYSSRLSCSLAEADERVATAGVHDRPLLATLRAWPSDQYRHVSTQVLQEFDTGAFVVVTNIPGPVHLRYLHLDQRQSYIDEEGRHVVRFGAIAADSDANARYHEVEKSLSNVEWIREGGVGIKLTEVDEYTVDVSFNRWAKCENELHAEQLSIQWAQFACKWAQDITSPKLLSHLIY